MTWFWSLANRLGLETHYSCTAAVIATARWCCCCHPTWRDFLQLSVRLWGWLSLLQSLQRLHQRLRPEPEASRGNPLFPFGATFAGRVLASRWRSLIVRTDLSFELTCQAAALLLCCITHCRLRGCIVGYADAHSNLSR